METTIRTMTTDDITRIVEIEQAAFITSAWNRETFEKELNDNKFAHYHVLEIDGVVIGYFGMWIVEYHAQITTIAVDKEQRGKKYGALLLEYAMTLARTHQVDVVSLEVRVNNTAAIGLYESFGFNYGGIRKDYYGPGADANVMWVKLDER